ncbi:hypothetical protein QZH56_04030 [Streptomyces olivoreticuli]|uniref:Uncharacterized protein n=1 Tax=Streptomyces blastmyceticus TaxID=68180 RepID=A0ABP3HAQ8_9ACTN|nr:hypothetical protein [Streptomyces olivoreticuli]WKK24804.1 hypothetical protein QZH56_04030 [Streptomyces olivoreticuli]
MFRDRPRRTMSIAAAAVAAAGAVTISVLSLQPAAADGEKDLRLTTVQKVGTEPEHPRTGDRWVTYFDLHSTTTDKDGKERAGKRVGDASDRCDVVLARYEGTVVQCERVLRTDQGTLVLTSLTDRFGRPPYPTTAAVTGGTGTYAGATGEARLTLNGDGASYRIQLR